jgi:putative alpha-1,2-mannosidase
VSNHVFFFLNWQVSILIIAFTSLLTSPLLVITQPSDSLIQFVNPFIGTREMGHTFPGACVLFGIVGFSHTHFSGTPFQRRTVPISFSIWFMEFTIMTGRFFGLM